MATANIFRRALGLNNLSDPTRIKHDFESGQTDLAIAYNVDIDNFGRVEMRRGLTATDRTESVNSIFCDGGECLYTSGSALYRLNPDYTRTGVRSGMTATARCYFCQIANKIYYMNGFESGYVINGVSYAWIVGTYSGPATYRTFSNPPTGTILEFYSSRIYVVVNEVLWYSEPFAYGWFDMARNFIPFGSPIRMVRAVATGLYVGTSNEVIYLGGAEPSKFDYRVVSDSPVVEGTDAKLNSINYDDGRAMGQVAIWTAQDGIYVGMPDGQIKNVTRDRLSYPSSFSGCAVVKDNKYISLLK